MLHRPTWAKGSLYKSVGNRIAVVERTPRSVTVEIALNNRPLDYVEDDIELPILTPSSLLHVQPNTLPQLEPNHIQESEESTWASVKIQCGPAGPKNTWGGGVWERHCLKHKGDSIHPAEGDLVIIKSEEKNCAQWKLGVVIDVITG